MHRLKIILALLFASITLAGHAGFVDARREVILYSSGRWTFNGYIYKPEGNGPFPVVVWNHGHHEHLTKFSADAYDELSKLYTREGFVLFIPDRHLGDVSRSELSFSLQKLIEQEPGSISAKEQQVREELEINAKDIVAALVWLKEQPYVDRRRIALSGWSSGAGVALMAAEQSREFKAVALFSPGTTSSSVVQSSLRRAAGNCLSPIFLVQAQDEPPSDAGKLLVQAIEKKGQPHRVQVYAHNGYNKMEKNALAINGIDAWGYDVLRFLQGAMKD